MSLLSNRINTFPMRDEQEYTVKITSEYFNKYSKEKENGRPPHFLWNAKMRFGKTFTTYQLAKKMGWTKILVLTFKPAVKTSWEQDLLTHVDFKDWQFISTNEVESGDIDKTKPYVRFASFQDVLQKTDAGGIKPHNTDIHLTEWDCIVLDEYHFGAFRNLNKDLGAIINKSEEIKKTKKEKQETLSKEEKKQLTEEEKEIKSKRKKIQEQLLQFAKRVPVFMYLTDDREQTLLDVIQQLETDLFTKVTNLTLNDFNRLIEIGIFNESTMNDAVFAFKRFEDSSLIYLDDDTNLDDTIGGWNTRIKR